MTEPADAANFKITYEPQVSESYMDGFADGYSRAWQECWEYLRGLAQQEKAAEGEE